MTKKLAIFDMDGTLFDTREANFLAYQTALQDQGFCLEHDFFTQQCNGKYYKDFIPQIIGNDDAILMEKIHNRKKEMYASFLDHVNANNMLLEILRILRPTFHIALVTTASKTNCLELLNFFNYESLFDLILTKEDVERTKPNPEGFIRAMEHFAVNAKDTIIFEDSDDGISAAKASGASVVVAEKF